MRSAAALRVLVADDSPTMRRRLIAALERAPGIEVVAEAADGRLAVELCRRLRPDVVALDLVMPDVSGLEATEEIMASCPTPILIVAAADNLGGGERMIDAQAAGAVEVLEKPGTESDDRAWDAEFARLVRLIARVRVITHPRARLRSVPPPRAATDVIAQGAAPSSSWRSAMAHPGSPRFRALVMAASTGGPAAVAEILRALSPAFQLPIFVVVHVGSSYSATLADWLERRSGLQVSLAVDGAPLPPVGSKARVFLAPADRHLVIEHGRLRLTTDPERHSCRPSADVLFESAARELGPQAIGCLLTGMGRDGAAGLLSMHRAGAPTIAQDEASCAVFGMPRAAIELGAADSIVPLGEIAAHIEAIVAARASARRTP
ncbi:Chemotaxis response regulator protein-glutamate methylesterase CheB [Minicystis rosea]|nr:Chemotaxis response regulator protein-glutamate methylesterase CheB [Minicystis rosea]